MATINVLNDDTEGVSPAKSRNTGKELVETIHDSIKNLSEFKLTSILVNNTNRKNACLKGTFENIEGDALVILEKSPFTEENLQSNSDLFSNKGVLEAVFHNDIYGDYKYVPVAELNTIKATIIHPATEKHIAKYSAQVIYLVDETIQIYNEIVLPHVTKEQFDLQWVYNILEHKSETERIVFEDEDPETGFVLVPDLKWNGDAETLYLLAIVNKRNIKSLRDLTDAHLPLLQNIQKKGVESIHAKYGLDRSQLRIYFHYHPSFFHLHVHFCYLRHEAPGILAEKAHLLSNVISNIELFPNYYQKVTLPFIVREKDKLFTELEKSNILKKLEANK